MIFKYLFWYQFARRDSLLIDFEAFNAQPTESEETVNFNSEQLSSQHDRIIQSKRKFFKL